MKRGEIWLANLGKGLQNTSICSPMNLLLLSTKIIGVADTPKNKEVIN